MRIAVHYGCHLLRPQPAVRWDDPLQPDQGRGAGRARSARASSTTRPRCSAAAARSTASASATPRSPFARRKLLDLQRARRRRAGRGLPELLPAVRPQPGRAAARRRGRRRARALPLRADRAAYGHDAGGARARHAPRVAWSRSSTSGTSATPAASRGSPVVRRARCSSKCDACRACKDDCPVCTGRPDVPAQRDHRPAPRRRLRRRPRRRPGSGSASSASPAWSSATRASGMAETFRMLKELAIARAAGPEPVARGLRAVPRATGALGKPQRVRAQEARPRRRCPPPAATRWRACWPAARRPSRGGAATTMRRRPACSERMPDHARRMRPPRRPARRPAGERPAYREEAPFKIHGGCGLMGICDESGTRMSGEVAMRSHGRPARPRQRPRRRLRRLRHLPRVPRPLLLPHDYNDDSGQGRHRGRTSRSTSSSIMAEPIPTRPVERHRRRAAPLALLPACRDPHKLEDTELTADDYVVHAVMDINASIDGAFVASSGKNMGAFKGVGFPEEIGRLLPPRRVRGPHLDRPQPLPHQHPRLVGRRPPFTLLDWSIVHNGEIVELRHQQPLPGAVRLPVLAADRHRGGHLPLRPHAPPPRTARRARLQGARQPASGTTSTACPRSSASCAPLCAWSTARPCSTARSPSCSASTAAWWRSTTASSCGRWSPPARARRAHSGLRGESAIREICAAPDKSLDAQAGEPVIARVSEKGRQTACPGPAERRSAARAPGARRGVGVR